MSLVKEIERTDLCKNNLTTIKNNTNTALTQNGFKTIENFSQLPKILNDELYKFKKIAKESLTGFFKTSPYERSKTTKSVMRPAFVPGYVFLDITITRDIKDGFSTDIRENIVISISQNPENATIEYLENNYEASKIWVISASYNYNRNEITIEAKPLRSDTKYIKIQFNEIIFLSK